MKKMIKQFIFVTTFYIPRNTNIKTFTVKYILSTIILIVPVNINYVWYDILLEIAELVQSASEGENEVFISGNILFAFLTFYPWLYPLSRWTFLFPLHLLDLLIVWNFFFLRKCTFSPYNLMFFYFSLYILFLLLLVPKLINAFYLSPWS